MAKVVLANLVRSAGAAGAGADGPALEVGLYAIGGAVNAGTGYTGGGPLATTVLRTGGAVFILTAKVIAADIRQVARPGVARLTLVAGAAAPLAAVETALLAVALWYAGGGIVLHFHEEVCRFYGIWIRVLVATGG